MTPDEMRELKAALVITAELCGRELSDLAIRTMAGDLAHLDGTACLQALQRLRRKGRFPTVEDIENLVDPSVSSLDDAREAASLIVEAVSRHGYTNPGAARAAMGELAWQVVRRFGGWAHICETLNSRNQPTLLAQFRDIAETLGRRNELGLTHTRPALVSQSFETDRGGRVLALDAITARLPYDPNDREKK